MLDVLIFYFTVGVLNGKYLFITDYNLITDSNH